MQVDVGPAGQLEGVVGMEAGAHELGGALQAVRLLHPELAHVGEDRRPTRHGGGHGEGGDLVERGDLAGVHLGGRERPGGVRASVRRFFFINFFLQR